MIRNIDFSADFLCRNKCLVHIHISKPTVNSDKGNIRLIIGDFKKFFIVKRVAAEIEGLILRFDYKPKRLDCMVGNYGGYLEIADFYTVADIKHGGIFSAEFFKFLLTLVCGYKILLGRYFRNRVGV